MAKRSGESPSYSVTSAGVNPTEDRAHRMRAYFISMTLRVACVLSLFWVRGWWVILPIAGAIILPWFAVMIGNAVDHSSGERVKAVDPRELDAPPPASVEAHPDASSALFVVDVEPVRRAAAGSEADTETGTGFGTGFDTDSGPYTDQEGETRT